MTDLTCVSVTSSAEGALKKLKKAQIGVYRCKKRGARFVFSVRDGQLKKVFAIFSNPCYNVAVERHSGRKALLIGIVNRIGLVAGGILFLAAALISNMFVLKISVNGSGSYLENEIKRIVYASGAHEGKLYGSFDLPLASGRILALPQVTFCDIQKRGAVLVIDVEVTKEHTDSVVRGALVSDIAGSVERLVVICGTAAVSEGASVKSGDELIIPYTSVGEELVGSFAVGYCTISYGMTYEYAADCESEQNLASAYALANLEEDEISSRTYTVRETDEGVVYSVNCTCLRTLRINM